jgi:exopolyphosphatase / guanosine-5'-triphosphate,3'-diphosphate pyrophosphatase
VKLATFDVGTNTVLMLAVEAGPDGKPVPLLELSRITRVGKGVDRTGRLDPAAVKQTLDTIVEFAAMARAAGVEKMVGVATSAIRDAGNGAELIRDVKAKAGVELRVVSGREEAELSRLAVVRGLALDPDLRLLIADIGGGSTELIRSQADNIHMVSLQIGSVRLTERFIHSDPPSAKEIAALTAAIDAQLDHMGWLYRPDALVGIAGTVTTICAVALGMESYDSSRVHGHVLPREEISRTVKRFGELPLVERKKLKGLAEARADVIFAGGLILERIIERFQAPSVIVSDQGVRWGLMWRELERGAG